MIAASGAFLGFMAKILSNEFFLWFIYAFQIFALEFAVAFFIPRRSHFLLRAIVFSALYCILAVFAATFCARNLPSWQYVSMYALSIVYMILLYRTNFWNILFCAVVAVVVQNMSYSFGAIASLGLGVSPDPAQNMLTALIQVPVYLLVTVATFALFGNRIKKFRFYGEDRIPMIILALFSIFLIFRMQYYMNESPLYDTVLLRTLFITCDVMGLCLLFGIQERSKLKEEKEILQQIMAKEAKNYELSKKTVEMINIKCHDLKHQIAAIREMPQEEQKANLDEIEEQVMIYNALAKTGNAALDVILTSKAMLCEKYKIFLNYMADGEKINFIDTLDIYSLFGNALDNAIEAVNHVEKEKRIIYLRLNTQGNFLSIHIENYCKTPLVFKNGLPKTTKKDEEGYHGYGLKSIAYITDKYHGVMKTSIRDEMFCLDITIPRQ